MKDLARRNYSYNFLKLYCKKRKISVNFGQSNNYLLFMYSLFSLCARFSINYEKLNNYLLFVYKLFLSVCVNVRVPNPLYITVAPYWTKWINVQLAKDSMCTRARMCASMYMILCVCWCVCMCVTNSLYISFLLIEQNDLFCN